MRSLLSFLDFFKYNPSLRLSFWKINYLAFAFDKIYQIVEKKINFTVLFILIFAASLDLLQPYRIHLLLSAFYRFTIVWWSQIFPNVEKNEVSIWSF